MLKSWKSIQPYALVTPQTLVLVLFLVLPILMILLVSFWQFDGIQMIPSFTLDNYKSIFTSDVTLIAFRFEL